MSDAISRFKEAFGYADASAQDNGSAQDGGFQDACRAASKEWQSTRETIRVQLKSLRDALAETYAGEAVADTIVTKFNAKVAPFLSMIDARFSDTLSALADAEDAAVREKQAANARTLAANYQKLLDNPTLADINDNPFVQLSIRESLSKVLTRLPKELQSA